MYLLASSLAAASLDGHFEHPAQLLGAASHGEICNGLRSLNEFFRSLLVEGGIEASPSSLAMLSRPGLFSCSNT